MKLEDIKSLLDSNDRAVERAMVVLFERQTADEQASNTTSHKNGRGFNGLDANFGSSLARQVMAGRRLSPKQLQYARKMAHKYAGQLLEEAELKANRAA